MGRGGERERPREINTKQYKWPRQECASISLTPVFSSLSCSSSFLFKEGRREREEKKIRHLCQYSTHIKYSQKRRGSSFSKGGIEKKTSDKHTDKKKQKKKNNNN